MDWLESQEAKTESEVPGVGNHPSRCISKKNVDKLAFHRVCLHSETADGSLFCIFFISFLYIP